MLRRLRIQGLKSLQDVELELPRVAVLAGPNAAGKSNVLDAVQLLARIATQRTLSEALTAPIRGFPAEAFTLPEGGLPALLEQESARLLLEADLEMPAPTSRSKVAVDRARYRVAMEIDPDAGALSVADGYLTRLTKAHLETTTCRRAGELGAHRHPRWC